MNRKLLFFSLMISVILTGAVTAQILFSKPLSQKGVITSSADVKIVREDDINSEISEINWGAFLIPDVTVKQSSDILGTRICLKNVGGVPVVVGWRTVDKPSYLTITATWAGNDYPEDNFSQFRIDPGYVNGFIVFTLTVNDLETPPQPFAFDIVFDVQQAP